MKRPGYEQVLMVAAIAFAVIMNWRSGSVVGAVVFGVLGLVLAWWTWPSRRGEHVSHAEAHAAAADSDLIAYWRPG
ncbi:MAG: hypothetical protein AAF467_24055 [Actinomycetota bacterium]